MKPRPNLPQTHKEASGLYIFSFPEEVKRKLKYRPSSRS